MAKDTAERIKLVRDLSKVLVKMDAIQFGTFKLTSGKLSSYYINLRLVPSFPDVFKETVTCYLHIIKNEIGLASFDAICGIATSGLTFAAAVAYILSKPLIYLRREKKEHGLTKRLEGAIYPGWKVLVLDDLATTGESILTAVNAVRSEGGIVGDAVVLIDRKEGAEKALLQEGVRMHAFTNISEISEILYDAGMLDYEQITAIRAQMQT
ncbi:MAG: orotate phosphoribosyltransferase [Nitrososphaerales archaeon]